MSTANQIANYFVAQSEVNIVLGAKLPVNYFKELVEPCGGIRHNNRRL